MNITNGFPVSGIELKPYLYKDKIYYDNLCMLDFEVSTGFLVEGRLVPFDRYKPNSFYQDIEKRSLVYLWNLCIDGYLFSGRSLDDLFTFLEGFNDRLEGVLYCYIHNAKYEFQFLRNILEDMTVFARKKRTPLKFTWKNIEFRCSYMLTRLSLDTWAKEKNLPVKKLAGLYDYSKLRTPLTPLTVLERDYGYNDVLVGVAGLEEYRERYKHVRSIPITQTSCIRKEVNRVLSKDFRYRKKIANATNISFETYMFLTKCFIGGYTHANIIFTNQVVYDLWDFDISSSYPWAMLSEKYPSTPFVKVKNYEKYMKNREVYAFAIRVEFTNIKCSYFNTYISASKCEEIEGAVLDNGRVMEAKRIVICILDVDWDIISKSHTFESKIIDFYFSKKDYLSGDLCRYILSLYKHKTELKGVQEMFTLYFKSKEEVNGIYGMGVTKDITDEVVFDGEWDVDKLTEKKYYEKRDKKVSQLYKLNISYAQGIYVPAYGRKNLWHMVHKFDDIIAYMDTDSTKMLMFDEVLLEMDRYNKLVHEKQKEIAARLGVSYEDFNPRDAKGDVHSIGVFERDKDIKAFKTLGAKRYICQYDESEGLDYMKMTVAGVRKKAVRQLCSIEDFKDDLVFDTENAQKLLLVYDDSQPATLWKEGEQDEWLSHDQYGIASYNIPYSMKMSPDYLLEIKKKKDELTQIFQKRGFTQNDKKETL